MFLIFLLGIVLGKDGKPIAFGENALYLYWMEVMNRHAAKETAKQLREEKEEKERKQRLEQHIQEELKRQDEITKKTKRQNKFDKFKFWKRFRRNKTNVLPQTNPMLNNSKMNSPSSEEPRVVSTPALFGHNVNEEEEELEGITSEGYGERANIRYCNGGESFQFHDMVLFHRPKMDLYHGNKAEEIPDCVGFDPDRNPVVTSLLMVIQVFFSQIFAQSFVGDIYIVHDENQIHVSRCGHE